MKWKSVFAFYSEVPVTEFQLDFEGAAITIKVLPEEWRTPENQSKFNLLYIRFDLIGKIEEAYLLALSTANRFLNRVSLVGYCKAYIDNHIITTSDTCEIGEEFEVFSTDIHHTRNYQNAICAEDILSVRPLNSDESYIEAALTFLRKGLSSDSLEENILMLAACLERLGSELSPDYVIKKCTNCYHEETTQIKATKKFSEKILKDKGGEKKDIENFLNRDRNKIAHGGGKRDIQFYSDLKLSLLKIQGLVTEIVAELLNAKLVNSQTSIIDLPAAIYKFVRQNNDTYELTGEQSIKFASVVGISEVKNMSQRAKNNLIVDFYIKTDSSNTMLHPGIQKVFFPK